MPNDISGINSGRSQHSGNRQLDKVGHDDKSSESHSSSHTGSGDTVSLTDMAARLKTLEQNLATQPEVDQARIDRVRDAISRGEFRIDPERVANKMMDFESDF